MRAFANYVNHPVRLNLAAGSAEENPSYIYQDVHSPHFVPLS